MKVQLRSLILFFGLLFGATACADNSFTLHIDAVELQQHNVVKGQILARTSADGMSELFSFDLADGKAVVKGEVPNIRTVRVIFFNTDDKLVQKKTIILEPGEYTLRTGPTRESFKITGGKYNDLILNSWKQNPEYLKSVEAQNQLMSSTSAKDLTPAELSRMQSQGLRLVKKSNSIKARILKDLAENHQDPIVRLLAIQNGAYKGWGNILTAVQKMESSLPGNPVIASEIAYWSKMVDKRNREKAMQPGVKILDFTASTIDGESVTLSNILPKHKLVLVEFWASWCGPCRAEIPHLKEAYESFKDKGFTILSYSVDHSREDWEEASEDEELPWLNLSDLKAFDSPITKQYGITGVPVNYLVDGTTGKIVDLNLRGKRLDKVLAERLD